MRNQLLYYQGGGYDGCIWEWNFCFWDARGIWHNLYASGCDGAKTEAKAIEIAETLCFNTELVNLTDAERYKQFQQDNNAYLVLKIAQILNEDYEYDLEITCSECGDTGGVDAVQVLDDYKIICNDCFSIGVCNCCNEYIGEENLRCLDEDNKIEARIETLTGCNIICEDCFEYNKECIKTEDLKALRFQAFCTGEPDIFSDGLRAFWGT